MADDFSKRVDEDWKRQVELEKERESGAAAGPVRRSPRPPPAPPRGAPPRPEPAPLPPGTAPPASPPEKAPESPRPQTDPQFLNFIQQLTAQALLHLGEIEHPATGEVAVDLEQARDTIDILEVLKNKTRGNLSSDEGRLMDQILYDLRMRFVERQRKG